MSKKLCIIFSLRRSLRPRCAENKEAPSKVGLFILLIVWLGLSACNSAVLPSLPDATATHTSSPPATLTTPPASPQSTATPGPISLRIWLPPQFDPNQEDPASRLLKERLDAFVEQHPGVRIETRIKAQDGPGGLLDALSAANAAAPLALPDLILLPRVHLETAALKGLLTPFDGSSTVLDEDDWFDYASQLARLQDSIFGLPFAGDGQVLLYRPAEVSSPPKDWLSLLNLSSPLIFPAGDDQALFTLQQYLATGAPVQDADGRPTLDPAALTGVLTQFAEANAAGIMPFWLTQFITADQAWEAYTANSGDLIAAPASRYTQELPGDSLAAPLPTQDGKPFTLVNGWVWALSNPHPDRHQLSVALAEFLTSGDFLADWTAASGYLPPRRSALAGWPDRSLRSLVGSMVESAHILPPADVLAVISPALQQATIAVLKQESDPDTAARQAIELLRLPDSTP
jgi:ABC-type glycerol-3-phosphate transport system substrate-binding protein